MIGNIEVIENWWFSGSDVVGIVLGRDQITGNYQFYVGVVKETAIVDEYGDIQLVFNENSEAQDIEYILKHGAKFPQDLFVGVIAEMLSAITLNEKKRKEIHD